MYYIFGDIHGHLPKLTTLINKIEHDITPDDTLIFLGDYIDRGPYSYEVLDYLVYLSRQYRAVFLKGNHEDMLLKVMNGENILDIYLINGGEATISSYKRNLGEFRLPDHHAGFFKNLILYYQGEDFIAVHAGLNPINSIEDQSEEDFLWIREKFFRSDKRWDKTVIFGHTPTPLIIGEKSIYFDEKRNIIGIDTGVIYGGPISCLRWPDRKVYVS